MTKSDNPCLRGGPVPQELSRVQVEWSAGKICCGRNGGGPSGCRCVARWEADFGRFGRTSKRTARVLLCLYREHLVALHGSIKKTRTTPDEDVALARKRNKEFEQ